MKIKNLKFTAHFGLFFALFFAIASLAKAQNFELGGLLGGSNYQGDLTPSSTIASFGSTRLAAGGFVRYNINDYLGIRANVQYCRLTASDQNSKDLARQGRNLSFRSDILEAALLGEINILGFQPYNFQKVFSPYLFGGIALFHFNPKAAYQNQWVALQPLGTEGQGLAAFPERKKYARTQISIPVGAGIKYALTEAWTVGLELGIRKTFTDYLDDVSSTYIEDAVLRAGNGNLAADLANRTGEYLKAEPTPFATGAVRGNEAQKDWYLIGRFTISYHFLDNGLAGSRRRSRGNSGCPTF